MSRDQMLPFSGTFTKVSKRRRSPYAILIVCGVISILFTRTAKVESTITSVSSVAIFAAYFLVILGGLKAVGSPPVDGSFSLGRAARPLAYLGWAWCVLICCALTIQSVGHTAGESSLVMIAIGVIWYFCRVRGVR